MLLQTMADRVLLSGHYTLSRDRRLVPQDEDRANAARLAFAVRRLEIGDNEAALKAASEACHEASGSPEPHYVYGQAWAAIGRHAEAERAFAAALQLAPQWADAWVNFGLARYCLGAMDDAIAAMQQALRHAPDHAAAAANLGTFLRLTGSAEDGETLLRSALAAAPDNIAARLNLVADCLSEERSDEALALLEGVPPRMDPMAARHVYLARALAHLQQRRAAEASAALTACAGLGPIPAALAPLWHWRHLLLALVEGDEPRARVEAEQTEQALVAMGAEAVPEHRIMTHYELAKFWSGLGAYSRAFGLWMAAHKLLAQSQPFDREALKAFFDANIATFTRQRFATGARAANRDPAPVFIVGMPRSGTTLCEQILSAHRDVHGAGERPDLGRLMQRLGGETPDAVSRLAELNETELNAAAGLYLAELHALAPEKARIVDKLPHNFKHLALVGLMLPGARIIHCTRDPRDIGLSIFTFRFHGEHAYAHDLRDLGWTICQQERLMAHWKAVLPASILTVALSDWVRDFEGTLARVLAYLDLPADPACARFYECDRRVRTASWAQVRQPINGRGLGRWHAYATELAPLIAELGIADVVATGHVANNGDERSGLHVLPVADPARALGLATHFLMSKAAFAGLKFGSWAHVLSTQVERGHYRFIADEAGRVRGFFGWALTDQTLAEEWVSNRRVLRSTECRVGDCVILNAWAADTNAVHRCIRSEARRIVEHTAMLYGKRFYRDGRVRPLRLASTDFLRSHIEWAEAHQEGAALDEAGRSSGVDAGAPEHGIMADEDPAEFWYGLDAHGKGQSGLHVLPTADPARDLGLATYFLSSKPVFAGLDFGYWAQILSAQVERGHYRFIADEAGRVRGFFGWALTDQVSAEEWVSDRRALLSTDCRAGDCIILNTWAADTNAVHRFMWNEFRRVSKNTRMLYWKRFYPDGRRRLVRLGSTDFLRSHIERADARQEETACSVARRSSSASTQADMAFRSPIAVEARRRRFVDLLPSGMSRFFKLNTF